MTKQFYVVAQALKPDGSYVINPDGSNCHFADTISAGSPHTAVNVAVSAMGARFDKVMGRFYKAPAKLGVGDTIRIQVTRSA